jgi:hypothetical protein
MDLPPGRQGEAPQYSEDGRWWWNGEQWMAVSGQGRVERPLHDQIRLPAIMLIVIGGIDAVLALLWVLSVCYGLATGRTQAVMSAGGADYSAGYVTGELLGLVGVFGAPLVLVGGIRMLLGRSYALSQSAAVLAMIPGVSCCFVLGIPAGIWALVTLHRPGIRAAFQD